MAGLVLVLCAALLPPLLDLPAAPPEPRTAGRAVRPVDGAVIRLFDPPSTPYGRGHRGVDLAAEPGTRVRATLGGTVAFSGPVAGHGWVTVDHGGGVETTYGWLDPRRVAAGELVRAGEVLGLVAPEAGHLDWGARLHGVYIDPLSLLGVWRARLVAVTAGGTGRGSARVYPSTVRVRPDFLRRPDVPHRHGR